jgi:cytochrome c
MGDVAGLEKLLDSGAQADARESEEDLTPLMLALRSGHVEAARTLLGRGAQVESWDGWGESPAHWAVSSVECLELVAGAGADMAYRSVVVMDAPIHRAAREGRAESVEWLVSHGAAVDEEGDYGQTPLMMACVELKKLRRGAPREKAYMRVAESLVLAGADPGCIGYYNSTPIDALGAGAPGMFGKRLMELFEAREAIAERSAIERDLGVDAKALGAGRASKPKNRM